MRIDGCNAEVQLLEAYYSVSDSFHGLPCFVKLLVCIVEWQSTLILPLRQLTATGIESACPLLHFRNSKARSTFDNDISTMLINGLKSGSVQRGYYFNHSGAITLPDGHTCFLRGAELIGECNRPFILPPEISDIRLLGTAQTDFLLQLLPMLIQAPPQVLLVLAFVILSSVRSVLIESGIDLQAVLYIVGGQGLGKTTLASQIAGIYEQSKKPIGMIQAGATPAAANKIMSTLRDQPVIVDDLCRSISSNTARKRVDLASKLIRQGTGSIPIVKQEGNKTVELPCEVSLIFTAEIPLENLSDLTRCIVVPVREKLIIPKELTPALIGDAIRFYTKWLCSHLDEEIVRFHQSINNEEDISMDTRVIHNYSYIGAAFQSFICSLHEQGFSLNLENALCNRFEAALSDAIQEHQSMIEDLKSHVPVGNLPFCILEGYKNDAFDLTKNIKKLDKHDGILWHNDLCLRREVLIRFIRQQSGYQDWSPNKITRVLKDINALVLQEDEAATVRLTKDSSRVYRIRLNVLADTAQSY